MVVMLVSGYFHISRSPIMCVDMYTYVGILTAEGLSVDVLDETLQDNGIVDKMPSYMHILHSLINFTKIGVSTGPCRFSISNEVTSYV